MNRAQAQGVYEAQLEMETFEANGNISAGLYAPVYFPHTDAPVDSWRYRHVKRLFDLLLSAVMLLAFLPAGLLIAAAVVLTSPGPIFYREERVGRYGQLFRIWKFRTMQKDACRNVNVLPFRMRKHHLHLIDPRITRIGGFLRRWSLDEVPQLLNVLRGEMSIVGPRPIVEAETPLYERQLGVYLSATPGLSGLWQVSGRSNVDYSTRAGLDADYVMNWSMMRDISIVIQTIPAVLSRTGAR
jgi:lipopolysaccharide/colanic/teichoic acid biosynthesis glycosyltransferase